MYSGIITKKQADRLYHILADSKNANIDSLTTILKHLDNKTIKNLKLWCLEVSKFNLYKNRIVFDTCLDTEQLINDYNLSGFCEKYKPLHKDFIGDITFYGETIQICFQMVKDLPQSIIFIIDDDS